MEYIFARQVPVGMFFAALLFMPWGHKRDNFLPKFVIGIISFFAVAEICEVFSVESKIRLLIYTVLIFALIWICFECTIIHTIFYTTCSYAIQHISSKLTYMLVVPVSMKRNLTGYGFAITSLLLVSILIAVVVFFKYTRPYYKKGDLQFDNVRIVVYSGVFLVAAVYLSSLLESGFPQNSESYLTSYLCLNAFCILFALAILALEFSNFNVKQLEQENQILAQLLESDKEQYEQAKRDMEIINIRYHDIKQQYTKASDEERSKLEEEMAELNLRYFTGNKAVDITLTQKSAKCNEAGIQLICSADAGCLEHIKHYHIYSMLGNALDNAIECLEQVSDPAKKVIVLDIHKEKNMAVIRVENYTPNRPKYENGSLVTTKPDEKEHGYGVKSIQNTAEIYGGNAHIFVENEIFYLLITLPSSENITVE
ncbi:GHKL domain-containing protein [Butyrivibrio sp. YAB3001]|nr:GHKL domain-containing protein [Butyrivibrio sp. YAB3001]